jgi:hypothetical protein
MCELSFGEVLGSSSRLVLGVRRSREREERRKGNCVTHSSHCVLYVLPYVKTSVPKNRQSERVGLYRLALEY